MVTVSGALVKDTNVSYPQGSLALLLGNALDAVTAALAGGPALVETPTEISYGGAGLGTGISNGRPNLSGLGFTFNAAGAVTGGTVTGITLGASDGPANNTVTISGLSIPVAQFIGQPGPGLLARNLFHNTIVFVDNGSTFGVVGPNLLYGTASADEFELGTDVFEFQSLPLGLTVLGGPGPAVATVAGLYSSLTATITPGGYVTTRTTVALNPFGFTGTALAYTGVISANALFQALLGRVPDATSLAYWNGVAQSASLDAVATGLLGSAEGQARLGGLSDAAFVSTVLQGALGATPTSTELAHFIGSGLSRDLLAQEITFQNTANFTDVGTIRFLDGALYTSAYSTGGTAEALVQAVLGRTPDTATLGFWDSAVQTYGAARTAQGLLGSAEGQARLGGLGNTALITALYQGVLGRAPDSAGLAFWTGQLAAEASAAAVTAGIASTSEVYAALTPRFAAGVFDVNPLAIDLARLNLTAFGQLGTYALPDLANLENGTLTLQAEAQTLAYVLTQHPGTQTNAGFVNTVIQNSYGTPDPAASAYYTAQLNAGAAARADVLMAYAFSPGINARVVPYVTGHGVTGLAG